MSRVADKNKPQVLASASRIYDEKIQGNSYSFVAKSPVNTVNSARILLPSKPNDIKVTDSKGNTITDVKSSWDATSHTLYLSFDNSHDGIHVSLKW